MIWYRYMLHYVCNSLVGRLVCMPEYADEGHHYFQFVENCRNVLKMLVVSIYFHSNTNMRTGEPAKEERRTCVPFPAKS